MASLARRPAAAPLRRRAAHTGHAARKGGSVGRPLLTTARPVYQSHVAESDVKAAGHRSCDSHRSENRCRCAPAARLTIVGQPRGTCAGTAASFRERLLRLSRAGGPPGRSPARCGPEPQQGRRRGPTRRGHRDCALGRRIGSSQTSFADRLKRGRPCCRLSARRSTSVRSCPGCSKSIMIYHGACCCSDWSMSVRRTRDAFNLPDFPVNVTT